MKRDWKWRSVAQFEQLIVWKKAHELVLDVYKLTKKYPQDEKYRLVDQICRAVSSVPTNISEGSGRNTDKEFIQFLCVARGSLFEVKYQLRLSKDLGYITDDEYETLTKQTESVGRMLNCLIKKIRDAIK
jgi:four helix bundle protein